MVTRSLCKNLIISLLLIAFIHSAALSQVRNGHTTTRLKPSRAAPKLSQGEGSGSPGRGEEERRRGRYPTYSRHGGDCRTCGQ